MTTYFGSTKRHLYRMPTTVSRPLVIFLGAVACLALALYVSSPGFGYIADGYCDRPFEFEIVDSSTGMPIKGAIVSIWDSSGTGLESPPRTIGENVTKRATDEKGQVAFTCHLIWSSHHQGQLITEVVSAYSLWLIVDSTGYDTKRVPLNDVIGRNNRPSDWPLPSILVSLSRKEQRSANAAK